MSGPRRLGASYGEARSGKWRVWISKHMDLVGHESVAVYIVRELGNGKSEVLIPMEPDDDRDLVGQRFRAETFESGDYLPGATLIFNLQDGVDIFRALAGALIQVGAMPPQEEERVEGELKATKAHLQDLRELVFTSDVIRESS